MREGNILQVRKRRNIIKFFEDVTGLTPTEYQKEFLLSLVDINIKKVIASAGRQTGKTLCAAVATLWFVYEYPRPVKILLISAQDSWIYEHIRDIMNNNKDLASEIVAEGVYSIVPLKGFETKKGSRVHVRGSTDKQIRGIGCDIVIIDEACEIKNEILTTALGNLSGDISKYIMISTPHKDNLFTDIARNPKKYGFKLYTWSAEDCHWHSKELLRSKKKMLSPQKYKVEVLGLPLKREERAFFDRKDIEKCIHSNVLREGKGTLEIGIDWGYGRVNTTCLVMTEKIYSRRKVLLVKTWKDVGRAIKEIAEIINKYNPNIIKADSMPIEFRGKLEVYVKNKIHYIPAQRCKEEMLGQLKFKIRSHQLEIDDKEVDLIKELKRYRKGKRSGDNRVDALALSIYESPLLEVKPSGKVIFSVK